MKHWILSIALLTTSQIFACGPWYPYGDEVRFSLFEPSQFDDGSMSRFYYTANQYGNSYTATPENDLNTAMWFDYCNAQVDLAAIFQSVYSTPLADYEQRKTSDPMIAYLVKNNLKAALDYMAFAKSCSDLNYTWSPWEREKPEVAIQRNKKIKQAQKRAKNTRDLKLKKRYNFLALRLAFYNNDKTKLGEIYNSHFSLTEQEDLLDYWALHYFTMKSLSGPQSNYQLSKVFAHAPGKRFAVSMAFNRKILIEEVLSRASTDEERANIYVMYALRDKGRSKRLLTKIYELDPSSELLKFLIVREINKIEDWVLTPRYSMFPPSMESGQFYSRAGSALISTRIEADKEYAEEIATWLSDRPTLQNTALRDLGSAYLYGISGDLRIVNEMLAKIHSYRGFVNLHNQLSLIFSIQSGSAIKFLKSDHAVIMHGKSTNQEDFLFAIARELEYRGETTLAAAFFSQLNQSTSYYSDGSVWKSPKGASTLYADFYHDWFFYLDGQYSAKQIQDVIKFANIKVNESDEFELWIRKYLQPKINRLHDLVGTKYIRQNELDKAIAAFKNVGPGLWDKYPYKNYLDANPFYTDFNSEHSKTPGDTIRYTKLEIAEQLQALIKKANRGTKNSSHYYFQAANCYFNMTHNGNSWMMTRYYWSRGDAYSVQEDEGNYYTCTRAKEYYLKAMNATNNHDLKALCLRMVGRCESYELSNTTDFSWDEDYSSYGGYRGYLKSQNKGYAQLKAHYGSHYKEMMGNCTTFEKYYALYK